MSSDEKLIFEVVTLMPEGKPLIIGTPLRKLDSELSITQRIARSDVALGLYVYKSRYNPDYKALAEKLTAAFADGLNASSSIKDAIS